MVTSAGITIKPDDRPGRQTGGKSAWPMIPL